MTAFASAGIVVPAPRAATPQIPTPRRPVDRAPSVPSSRPGRHRIVVPEPVRPAPSSHPVRVTRNTRAAEIVSLAARAGTVVTLAAMLVAAMAAAGLTDGVAPTGDAAKVASATLR